MKCGGRKCIMEGAGRRRCKRKSKCGVGCVIEGEEKAGGGWRSSEEQEEQMKWEVKKRVEVGGRGAG